MCSAGWVFWKKEIFQEKWQCFRPASVMPPCEFMKTGLHHGSFLRNIWIIFGIFICLVSQIITFLIGVRQGNCLSVIGETVLKALVKCHKYLTETELFPKSFSSKKLFWKVLKISPEKISPVNPDSKMLLTWNSAQSCFSKLQL